MKDLKENHYNFCGMEEWHHQHRYKVSSTNWVDVYNRCIGYDASDWTFFNLAKLMIMWKPFQKGMTWKKLYKEYVMKSHPEYMKHDTQWRIHGAESVYYTNSPILLGHDGKVVDGQIRLLLALERGLSSVPVMFEPPAPDDIRNFGEPTQEELSDYYESERDDD